jgi:LAO/AO transport system kinase
MTEHLNSNFKRKKRPQLTLEQYVAGIEAGDASVLSQAITLLESQQQNQLKLASEILTKILEKKSEGIKSLRIGITGVPGVGKSTFIESFGYYLAENGYKVAVLAIDPSSQKSGGSILGDKTRMEKLVQHPNVFIRPTPSKGSLGGVAKATRESMMLCEAAGYSIILIETVGVGQSEIAVRGMVDFFLLLMLAGAGDELQGIKRGIMEMADALVITKAEGDNLSLSRTAMANYKNALHLFPASDSGWIPQVEMCSALTNYNIDKVWNIVENYQQKMISTGYLETNRQQQSRYWLNERIVELLKTSFFGNPKIKDELKMLEKKVLEGVLSPFLAAEQLVDLFTHER